MNKEIARKLLQEYLDEKKSLPIFDDVVAEGFKNNEIAVWTFRDLLQIVYFEEKD